MRLWKPIIGLMVLALVLSGCYVQSLNPFYAEKDLITDDEIVGEWSGSLGNTSPARWKFEKDVERGYRLTIVERGMRTPMVINLFKMQGENFMDFAPEAESLQGYAGMLWAPVHLVAKYTMNEEGLVLYPLNLEWFKNMALKRKTDVEYTVYGENLPLLIDDTENIQAFLAQYIHDAFAENGKIELRKVSAEEENDSDPDQGGDQESQENDEAGGVEE